MGIKCTEKGTTEGSRTYPKLMVSKSTGCIVLFTAENRGVLLREGNSDEGSSREHVWAESNFYNYEGELILKND